MENVIASGEYQLNPDFSTVTRKSSEFGVESLFEISYADELSTITEGNRVVAYCGARTPWFKAGTSGISETGWGWSGPGIGLYEAFVAAGEDVRRRGTVMSEQELINDFRKFGTRTC
ncbi:hypothetical protein AGMMS49574_29920 [Bacteroidia bacterium]|nr:hypothetical protein AGMMS49574_29920 [Bacteroidia bacterium]GHV04940.1 hypothetical protein FACS189416_3970 [Bacteroidia bacterium]